MARLKAVIFVFVRQPRTGIASDRVLPNAAWRSDRRWRAAGAWRSNYRTVNRHSTEPEHFVYCAQEKSSQKGRITRNSVVEAATLRVTLR